MNDLTLLNKMKRCALSLRLLTAVHRPYVILKAYDLCTMYE